MGVRIIESQEAERRKGIARDLHDGPAQNLAGMMIRLDLLQSLGKTHINRILEEMENIKQMLAASLSEIRRIMFDLRPAQLQADDFCAALSDFFKDYEAKYDMHIHFVVGARKRNMISRCKSPCFSGSGGHQQRAQAFRDQPGPGQIGR